jgi:hypothetical protein
MASRSVYELPDVAATLLYALQKHDTKCIVQTARELRISGESELLTNLITFAWILCDPFESTLHSPPSADTIYESLCTIASIFPTSLPKYVAPFPFPPPSTETLARFESTLHQCITAKLWKHMHRILTPLLHTNQFLKLRTLFSPYGISNQYLDLLESILYVPLSERLLLHMIVRVCNIANEPSLVESREVLMKKYNTLWNMPPNGGRRDRIFTIPNEARLVWNIRPKYRDRIQFSLLPPAILDTHASNYWKHATAIEPKEDTWYATYFPDDIPDEWSVEECTKSHCITMPPLCETRTYENDWTAAFLVCC